MDDAADRVIEQWGRLRPELDTTPVGVVVRIFRAARLLEQGLKGHFEEHGLETWEYDVLATLLRADDSGPLRMSDLAGAAMVTPGTLTNRVDRLVAKGLVARAADPQSRRTVHTTLTDRGRELADGLIEGHLANERDLIGGLTGAEQQQLAALLRKLLLSLGD